MKITQTTTNFAAKRGLVLDADDKTIWVSVLNENVEPMFSLFCKDDGTASYKGNIWLPQCVKEEIPAFYRTERDLRAMIAFIGCEMSKTIAELNDF